MTSDETIDGLDAIIEDLAEWELTSMDITSLQEYYVDAKIEYYHNNPEGLKDMLEYQKACTDPDTVFYWDVEKKDVASQLSEEEREKARVEDNE